MLVDVFLVGLEFDLVEALLLVELPQPLSIRHPTANANNRILLLPLKNSFKFFIRYPSKPLSIKDKALICSNSL